MNQIFQRFYIMYHPIIISFNTADILMYLLSKIGQQ